MILFSKQRKEGSGITQNFLSSTNKGIYPVSELLYVFEEINEDTNLNLSVSQSFQVSLGLCISLRNMADRIWPLCMGHTYK